MEIEWWRHFDAIFGLSLADNMRRREDLSVELERTGISDCVNFFAKITVRNEFYKYIWENPSFPAEGWWRHLTTALNCTMGHYEIMKEALALGLKRVLIIEDDIRFLKDLSVIDRILNNMPEDADIVLFDKNIPGDKSRYLAAKETSMVNDDYIDYSDVCLGSCGCYAVSERAIQVITKAQEKMFQPADFRTNRVNADGVVVNDDGLRRVASIPNLAVQDFRYKWEVTDVDKILYDGIADLNDYAL